MPEDHQLLREYAHDRSENAFTELVRRHVDLVYSAALRETHGDSATAEEITQEVFAELARKSSNLCSHPAIAGWLYTCVRRMSANARRSNDRRQRREVEAHTMNELLSSDSTESSWRQVEPVLDDAMHELSETDRAAVVLRFFEDRSHKEVGLALGLSESAARKRVDRALESLRALLARRGVTIGGSGLVLVISTNAVQAAPVGLAVTISTAVALAGTTFATAATAAATKTIAMTAFQKSLIAATMVVATGLGIYLARPDRKPLVTSQPAELSSAVPEPSSNRRVTTNTPVPETLFTRIYSPDTKQFAANLRGIRCPEETVKDIIVAEINRKYRTQEEALRPKPADHVPFMWSANPSERVLLERRQQAGDLARDKAFALREALGYEVPVAMPVYAMRSSNQRLEEQLGNMSPEQRSVIRKAQEDYWTRVQVLLDHTKGFWQSEDVTELEQLKRNYREIVEPLLNAQSVASGSVGAEQQTERTAPMPGHQADPPSASAPASVSKFGFDWAAVESSDYKQYAANLRTLAFPEELLRTILIADIDKLYASREEPLKPKPVPYDAPLSERQKPVSEQDWNRIRQLREVQIEKQTALQAILGIYLPRELAPPPNSRNLEAFEYALSQLPIEKRDAVQIALENDWYEADLKRQQLQKTNNAAFLEAYQRIREERNAIMMQHLSPEEFERFEMNTVPAGTELARRVIGMEPTDAEFLAMFRIARDHWEETGGIYGIWRAIRVSPEQMAAADAKLNSRLMEMLGEDRYLDYQMAVSETGQQLRNLAARYEMPRDILAQAFQVQSEAERLAKEMQVREAVRPDGSKVLIYRQSPQPSGELQDKLQTILGPVVWQAWTDGRTQRVKLDP